MAMVQATFLLCFQNNDPKRSKPNCYPKNQIAKLSYAAWNNRKETAGCLFPPKSGPSKQGLKLKRKSRIKHRHHAFTHDVLRISEFVNSLIAPVALRLLYLEYRVY
jgi:hypothetical protein